MSTEPRTAVLLIAHGSRNPAANQELHDLAARIAPRITHEFTVPCFLELAEPDIATAGDHCVSLGANRVLMVPYFLSSGVHVADDLAEARDELASRHSHVEFRLGPALGPHHLLDELVLLRIDEFTLPLTTARS
jgi:sirohydrochlorin ferrochelatase